MLPYTVFSPNGDNNRDTLDIYFRDASPGRNLGSPD